LQAERELPRVEIKKSGAIQGDDPKKENGVMELKKVFDGK
jgi:hypothetical protein